MKRILGYLLRIGAFVAIGPVVGGVAFLLVALPFAEAANREFMSDISAVLPAGTGPLFFFLGCYVFGWKAALATGLIVALVGPRIESRLHLLAIAGIVGAIAAAFLGHDSDEIVMALVNALIGAVAAVACTWLLSRRLMRSARSSAA